MNDPEEPVLPEAGETGDRTFTVDGCSWTARLAGEGLGGTGRLGLAAIAIVQFFADGEDSPSREAIMPAGRFGSLFESELGALLARARPLR